MLSGYDGMVAAGRPRSRPAIAANLTDAGERIVAMYQDWGKLDKAADWQQKLVVQAGPQPCPTSSAT